MGRDETLIKVKDAAEALSLSPRTVRDWVQSGRIEFVRLGGAIRIKGKTVKALIKSGTVLPRAGAGRPPR